jgi:hypothetical protein
MDPSSIEKIIEIDSHIGEKHLRSSHLSACAMSGLTPDARTMIERARVEAQVSTRFPVLKLELLVYIQRANEGRECDKRCVQLGHAVWRGR